MIYEMKIENHNKVLLATLIVYNRGNTENLLYRIKRFLGVGFNKKIVDQSYLGYDVFNDCVFIKPFESGELKVLDLTMDEASIMMKKIYLRTKNIVETVNKNNDKYEVCFWSMRSDDNKRFCDLKAITRINPSNSNIGDRQESEVFKVNMLDVERNFSGIKI